MGWFDNNDQQAIDAIKQNASMMNGIQVPTEKWDPIQAQTYAPETAQSQAINEDPNTISAQRSALTQMAGLAQNGLSDVDQAGYAKARQEAGQIQNSGTQAALANAQARGASGSGMEFAMREMANQNASNSAGTAGLQQAADSARQRAMYAQAYGNQLGQMRGQDYQAKSANANIVNQFNQSNTAARNYANQYNGQNLQSLQAQNQQGANNAAQSNFNNQQSKVNGIAGANQQTAQAYAAQGAANQSTTNALIGVGANYLTYGAYGAAKKQNGDD